MYDVITFGAGAMDIYVRSKKFFVEGKNICVPVGSKTEVEDIMMFSGGGGTNASATFAKQSFKTAYCGMMGEDCFGDLVIKELEKIKIDTTFVLRTKNKPTNVSVFLTIICLCALNVVPFAIFILANCRNSFSGATLVLPLTSLPL